MKGQQHTRTAREWVCTAGLHGLLRQIDVKIAEGIVLTCGELWVFERGLGFRVSGLEFRV